MPGKNAQFEDFIALFEAAWSGGDFSKVRALWSPEVEEPWHFPEELTQPIVGWDELDAYLLSLPAIIEKFEIKVRQPHFKPLVADIGVFRFTMDWCATLTSSPTPVGASVSVSGLLGPYKDELRMLHYMESGPAAFPFIQSAYERFAANFPNVPVS